MKTVNEFIKENNVQWFVSASDKFLSGWGRSNGKISKIVVCCNSLKQAREIEGKYNKRGDLARVNVCGNKPYYSPNRYDVSYYDFDLNLI